MRRSGEGKTVRARVDQWALEDSYFLGIFLWAQQVPIPVSEQTTAPASSLRDREAEESGYSAECAGRGILVGLGGTGSC